MRTHRRFVLPAYPIDIAGRKFGMLFVSSYKGKRQWECLCDCGNIVVKDGSRIRSGKTKSCGCLRKKGNGGATKIHGDHLTKLYALWRNFRYRCRTKTSKDFSRYGGRGATFCNEWDDYQTFKDWALKNGYEEGLTIERIDTNGPYNPENCCFTTVAENNRNKTNSRWWFIFGKRFDSCSKAASFFEVSAPTIYSWCGLRKKSNTIGLCYSVKRYPDV
jgi:hypothetical protein